MSLIQELEQIPFQGQRLERKYRLDQDILQAIRDISLQFNCSEEAVVETLLRFAVAQTWAFMDYSRLWENLSRREKEIIALACLDHTNQQIASRLGISSETVKPIFTAPWTNCTSRDARTLPGIWLTGISVIGRCD